MLNSRQKSLTNYAGLQTALIQFFQGRKGGVTENTVKSRWTTRLRRASL